MIICDYMVCQECGSRYKGKFEVSREGITRCIECEDKVIFGGMEKEKVQLTEDRMLSVIVKDLLIKDVKRIFVPKSEKNENQLGFLRKDDGRLDEGKIYFKGNPIELVMLAHKKAYICLEYIETGKKDFKDYAGYILNKYINLREYYMEENEQKDFYEELNGKYMAIIEGEVHII